VRAANASLFGFATVMVVACAWRVATPVDPSLPPVTATPAAPRVTEEDGRAGSGYDSWAWARPLFRQPASPAGPAAEITGSTAGSKAPKLVGIVTDGNRRLAIIAYNGAILRVDERQPVGAWTLVRVDPHSALLQDGQGSLRLRLDPTSNRD
jgi:hypothetical protein